MVQVVQTSIHDILRVYYLFIIDLKDGTGGTITSPFKEFKNGSVRLQHYKPSWFNTLLILKPY